jgi:transposase
MYRALPFLASQKNQLEEHLNKQISQFFDRNLSVAFYDVTTYYFESVKADDLKKFGYSKDNKVNQVQVVMGLLIDDKGIRSAMNYSLETPMISRLWSLYSYD